MWIVISEKGKMKVKISIVMPVHNTGVYLREALESIFNQSLQDFEVICVDDASDEEKTEDILLEYQSVHKNMCVIWLKENVGAGEARNIGFSFAKGEYVCFLDADDIFTEGLFEKLYRCIHINNADVCICGHEEFYIENEEKVIGLKWMPEKIKIGENDREDWLLNISTTAWDKLYRTRFLKENSICFQKLSSCNDVFFSCRVMINATKMCCIEEPLILYRTRTGNQISTHRNPVDLYKAMMQLYEVEKNSEDNLLMQQIGALLLRNGIWELRNCDNQLYKQQYYSLLYDFFSNHDIGFQNKFLEVLAWNIRNSPKEEQWIFKDMDFLGQLKMTVQELKRAIEGQSPLFLWGLGYRGDIFQKFCMQEGIFLQGVTDIKNCNVGGRTRFMNMIVSTDYVLERDGMIIACNTEIYNYLLKYNLMLINLDDYCVF